MAKITDFKFKIADKDYVVHVNCKSSGEFSANLPAEVHKALDLRQTLTATTLDKLEKEFYGALDRYKKASVTEELFIAIRYLSSGRFQEDKEGKALHGGYRGKYDLKIDWEHRSLDAIAFHFEVLIKESTDGVVRWFDAMTGKDMPSFNHDEYPDKQKYYKWKEFYMSGEKWKMIPFSQQALTTLKTAQEKIRQVSEALFHFVEQDEEQILLTLTKNKLLTN